ncbi:CDP-diacylglycerol--glycerol-3-phosphate 3-phosphatidyltransferase [Paenibacillus cellulosilyticus]|uniref:CDP-diacylglycerol--glycerol-3-phosphate 3-phosphatidyltransferase n=1 Tax=Paenibacillus cellulosilyticus TaxID=375489 RepID=A0A2V2YS61_9BACL|nr:CDP-diacylglycerol--glycerol-3-phosphate 3-phosphatidyltransferase [Paenibacillus cellulosilyticus]PWW00908.1 CDP-diacylglycerol--glycerol-3-phosphate 3-phosphatidyltransferase [Paenibacillus cellulosilyticus]QKS47564.1 CDP-diacylglycerol--glycerol-3-phosphate 3-phosphatidyltransferase [Paenibacillus cellulosilyticus]
MNLANKITVIRIAMIPLFMLVFQHYPTWLEDRLAIFRYINQYGLYWAVGLFVLASATDKLDGYIARKYNMITNLGKLLDPLADKLLVSVALIMMVQQTMIPSWIAVVIIGREVMVSGLRILAAEKGVALAADRHGKLKLVLQVVAITAVLLGNYPFQYVIDFPIDLSIMLAAVALTVYSGYQYVKNNYRELQLEW